MNTHKKDKAGKKKRLLKIRGREKGREELGFLLGSSFFFPWQELKIGKAKKELVLYNCSVAMRSKKKTCRKNSGLKEV